MAYSVWGRIYLISILLSSCITVPLKTTLPTPKSTTTEETPAPVEDVKTTESVPTTTLDYDLMDFDEFIANSGGSLSDFGPTYKNSINNLDSNVDIANTSVNVDILVDKTTNDPDYDYDTNNNSTSNGIGANSAEISPGVSAEPTGKTKVQAPDELKPSASGTEATDFAENTNDLSRNNDVNVANRSTEMNKASTKNLGSGEQNDEAIAKENTTPAVPIGTTDINLDVSDSGTNKHNDTGKEISSADTYNEFGERSGVSGTKGTNMISHTEEKISDNSQPTNGISGSIDRSGNSNTQVDSNDKQHSTNNNQQVEDTSEVSDDSIPESETEDTTDHRSHNEDESDQSVDKSRVSPTMSRNEDVSSHVSASPGSDTGRHLSDSQQLFNREQTLSVESGDISNNSPIVTENNSERSRKSKTATHTDSIQSTESDSVKQRSYTTKSRQQDFTGDISSTGSPSSLGHCFGHSGIGNADSKLCELARTVRMICTTIFPNACFKSSSRRSSPATRDSSYEQSNELSTEQPGIEILSKSLDNIGSSESTLADIREVITIIKSVCPSLCSFKDTNDREDEDENLLLDDENSSSDGDSASIDEDDSDDTDQERDDYSSQVSEDSNSELSEERRGIADCKESGQDGSVEVKSQHIQSKMSITSTEDVKHSEKLQEKQRMGTQQGNRPDTDEDERDANDSSPESNQRLNVSPHSTPSTTQNNRNQHIIHRQFSFESLSESDSESK